MAHSVATAHADNLAEKPERGAPSAAALFRFAAGAVASPLAASAPFTLGLVRMGARHVAAPRTPIPIGCLPGGRRRPGRDDRPPPGPRGAYGGPGACVLHGAP